MSKGGLGRPEIEDVARVLEMFLDSASFPLALSNIRTRSTIDSCDYRAVESRDAVEVLSPASNDSMFGMFPY